MLNWNWQFYPCIFGGMLSGGGNRPGDGPCMLGSKGGIPLDILCEDGGPLKGGPLWSEGMVHLIPCIFGGMLNGGGNRPGDGPCMLGSKGGIPLDILCEDGGPLKGGPLWSEGMVHLIPCIFGGMLNGGGNRPGDGPCMLGSKGGIPLDILCEDGGPLKGGPLWSEGMVHLIPCIFGGMLNSGGNRPGGGLCMLGSKGGIPLGILCGGGGPPLKWGNGSSYPLHIWWHIKRWWQ